MIGEKKKVLQFHQCCLQVSAPHATQKKVWGASLYIGCDFIHPINMKILMGFLP